MSIVSNNIKYLRRLNGLTQEQFARKIGIKRSLLGAYEEARANPNLTNLKNMAHAFGVSVDNLLKNDLRKLRETPDLGLPFNPATMSPASPLLRETTPAAPQPLAAVINRFQPPKPTLRLVARPITLKPVHRENFVRESPSPTHSSTGPLRFNNHYENSGQARQTSPEEPRSPQQAIQWVSAAQANDYLNNYQNAAFLNRLPVFQLPNLPAGHYRAFESGSDFLLPGALLVGTFIRNWFDIKDNTRYVLITKNLGIIQRITWNHVKAKGTLLLRSDQSSFPEMEILIKDVLEIWEIKAFVSLNMPAPKPGYEKLKNILTELRDELNRTDLPNNFLA